MDLDLADLFDLLTSLDGVAQPVRYHPEGDALFHSLQVFQHARSATDDRELWAAALLHDVGKSVDGHDHDTIGADLLEGLVSDRVVFLVRHHLDLLRDPKILVLDEATSALDARADEDVRRALGELSRGRTTLIVTHHLDRLAGTTRVLRLGEDGRIVDERAASSSTAPADAAPSPSPRRG